ncbi:MAG: DUF1822 family protein [Kaiparowitsia implicata GSE-PSE-MK54-09C]|jgi:hypothetical protein|nr:DUF1822 family protein [Kaiparowitsia implicata GSE-PSE-MK54-09C]
MVYNTDFSLTLPITRDALLRSEQFALRQPSPHKAAQVKHNTLAVQAVHAYLQLMGVATDLTAGDSWNPVVQLWADTADLEVSGIGRLECRPLVIAGREVPVPLSCPIPPEVWGDRIGYVVVQLNEAAREAELLGFSPSAAVEDLALNQLRPIEDLMTHLAALQTQASPQPVWATWATLGQWLQGLVDAGWSTAESVLNPPQLGYAMRSAPTAESPALAFATRQAKPLDVGVPLVLVMALSPDSGSPELLGDASSGAVQQAENRYPMPAESSQPPASIDMVVQVHPVQTATLPQDVMLQVLDETGAEFLAARSHAEDDYIQLQLSGALGERFQVRVSLGDRTVTEFFQI